MESLGRQADIMETGTRPGEKLHEILLTEFESKSTVVYDDEYLVILPPLDVPGLKEHYSAYTPVEFDSFSSSQNIMDKEHIRQLLVRGGFLT